MSTLADQQRFQRTLEAFDAANHQDPRQEQDAEGRSWPSELLYARRMSSTLAAFAPHASEALQLAARSQHIERWSLPRSDYPMNRSGYLNWRSDLKKIHAERAGQLMQAGGYEPEMVERVGQLLRKEGLKSDADCQTLEDVACLVFLRYYFDHFCTQHPHGKLIDIVRKTWGKMSEQGHQAALKLPLTRTQLAIVSEALGSAT